MSFSYEVIGIEFQISASIIGIKQSLRSNARTGEAFVLSRQRFQCFPTEAFTTFSAVSGYQTEKVVSLSLSLSLS